MQKNSRYIKVDPAILSDPQMGSLDDRTWRRAIELFLIANEFSRSSALPSIAEIAWTLRSTQEDIISVLKTLEQIGIASRVDQDNWHVTCFALI